MVIIDAHLDLSMNALQGNRDLLSSAYTIRTQETGIPRKGQGTVALPEMRQGRIALSFVTLFARSTGRPAPHFDFASPVQAYGIAQGQLSYYRALEEIRTRPHHHRSRTTWTATSPTWQNVGERQRQIGDASDHNDNTPALGFVVSMEGADAILHPDAIRDVGEWRVAPDWFDALRPRTLRWRHWYRNRVNRTRTVRLLAEMERLGVILDLTHCF